MSTHLRSQEFVDALDGALDANRLDHLESCASCRGEMATLRAVMADVKPAGAVPEPSPLFWDHFSERVRQATAEAPTPGPARWWPSAWRPLAALAGAAAVVTAIVVSRAGPHVQPVTPHQATLDSTAFDAFTDETESSLAFVSAAASDLSWEEARAVDLTPAASVVDSALERLTAAQRAELVKLIREELRSME